MPAEISEPTKAEIPGNTTTRASLRKVNPQSPARQFRSSRNTGSNGTRDMPVGSSPVKRCIMTVFPATVMLATSRSFLPAAAS